MSATLQAPQSNAVPTALDTLMDEIEHLWSLHIGILDEIDTQIEAAEDMGGELHVLETRAENLRDQIASTFSRLRNAGNNDKAWEQAFHRAGTIYEELVRLRAVVNSEVLVIAEAAEVGDATYSRPFFH